MPKVTCLLAEGARRLVACRYPAPFLLELESWSNDRISTEHGFLHRIPSEEWVVGPPIASVIMAGFCHPRPGGGPSTGPVAAPGMRVSV